MFAFVRNPLQRAASAWAYLRSYMADEPGCAVPWSSFCADPFAIGDACAARPDCCRRFSLADQYFHVLPQVRAARAAGRHARHGVPRLPPPNGTLGVHNANPAPLPLEPLFGGGHAGCAEWLLAPEGAYGGDARLLQLDSPPRQ